MNHSVPDCGIRKIGGSPATIFTTPPIGCVLGLHGLPGGGSNIYDRSPYGNNGTITGATWKQLANGLWCLDFDGTDDYVTIPDAPSLSALSQFTVLLWMQGYTIKNYPCLISKYYHSTEREWILAAMWGPASQKYPTLAIYDQSTSAVVGGQVISYDLYDQRWHQVAATWDGTTNYTGLAMYIDGLSKTLTEYGDSTNFAAVEDTTQDVLVGRQGNLTTRDFSGYIALVRVYNRALSALEIQSHYQQEKYLFGVV